MSSPQHGGGGRGGRSGWYPGKYLGRKKDDSARKPPAVLGLDDFSADGLVDHDPTRTCYDDDDRDDDERYGSTTEIERPTDERERPTVSWFKAASPEPSSRASTEGRGAHQQQQVQAEEARKPDTTESDESEAQDTKKEALIARTVRAIRQRVVARRLDANIRIQRVAGMVSTAIVCVVRRSEEGSVSAPPLQEERSLDDVSSSDRRALTFTDSLLDSLESRSIAWEGIDFSADVTLSRGGTIGLYGPFLSIIGFSISIEITATVQSLIASRMDRAARAETRPRKLSTAASST